MIHQITQTLRPFTAIATLASFVALTGCRVEVTEVDEDFVGAVLCVLMLLGALMVLRIFAAGLHAIFGGASPPTGEEEPGTYEMEIKVRGNTGRGQSVPFDIQEIARALEVRGKRRPLQIDYHLDPDRRFDDRA